MINRLGRLLLAGSVAFAAAAHAFPDRPVRLVVGFAPGGSDISARLVGQKLSELWGQPVVVDNRPGAAGNIGADAVAKAAPDGYTLLLLVNSYTINTSVYRNLGWDLLRDFAPIGRYATSPMVVVVNDKLPVKNFAEFVAYAKANRGKVNYGSAGTGTAPHLAGELFAMRSGIEMTHVPYKGSAPSVTALVADEVQASFGAMSAFDGMVKQGRLRALAVTTANRFPQLPDVPTVAETLKGFDIVLYNGIMGPAGIARDTVNRLNKEIARMLTAPNIRDVWAKQGADPIVMTPEQVTEHLKSDI